MSQSPRSKRWERFIIATRGSQPSWRSQYDRTSRRAASLGNAVLPDINSPPPPTNGQSDQVLVETSLSAALSIAEPPPYSFSPPAYSFEAPPPYEMPPAYRAIDSVAPRGAETVMVLNPSLDQLCGCGCGRTMGEIREWERERATESCGCGCGRSEREVMSVSGCGKTVAEIREWEREARRFNGGSRVKKCGCGCGRTEKQIKQWEKEKREKTESERRAARKECERVRQVATDRYSWGEIKRRCGWDLGGVNGRLWSGSGKLGDRGGTSSGRQAG